MALDVVVIHETDGRKYFEALANLKRQGAIRSLHFVGASVLWKAGHSILRERRSVFAALALSVKNLAFRTSCSRLRGTIVVLCMPPWDFRFLFYARLRRHNHLIYHTSWPYWIGFTVPRPGGRLGVNLRRRWLSVLKEREVALVAVTTAAANGLASVVERKRATVIPHVVSDVFFQERASYAKPFRLLFIGDLVESRGLRDLAEVVAGLPTELICLDIVGDGPLRDVAIALTAKAAGKWHGRITSRAQLARIVASSQLLVSPSIRTPRWEELFGMAIIEAMACGVPCIASDHVGPRSLIEHGVTGVLLPERSPKAIAEWIRRFANDEAAWTAMSFAAKRAAERSRLSAVSSRWKDVLQRVASGITA